VTFLGSIAHSELSAHYQQATVSVFPSYQEGFGLAVIEAMGCACPVIASDLPALRETVEHGITGILVPAGDVDELAQAMRMVLADASLRTKLAHAALVKARGRFDWPPLAARYKQIMQKLGGEDRFSQLSERRTDLPAR
jgi:glycosyltransferase involved in cell wall biosynthesis